MKLGLEEASRVNADPSQVGVLVQVVISQGRLCQARPGTALFDSNKSITEYKSTFATKAISFNFRGSWNTQLNWRICL